MNKQQEIYALLTDEELFSALEEINELKRSCILPNGFCKSVYEKLKASDLFKDEILRFSHIENGIYMEVVRRWQKSKNAIINYVE